VFHHLDSLSSSGNFRSSADRAGDVVSIGELK
jgi:hypothetical protein